MDFKWHDAVVSASLGEVRLLQGRIIGQMYSLGLPSKEEKNLDMLTSDLLNSFGIEDEKLDPGEVRSSIARHLGLNIAGLVPTSRYTDGIVEMMLDAAQNYREPLTEERLFGWHASLFPTGYSGMNKITVAQYRTEEMKVVSGPMGKEKIHYEAIAAKDVKAEMDRFFSWFNDDEIIIDNVLKSAIAHLWFVIIHPFDDGNGRIARAVSDIMLARSENTAERFYSLSKQFLAERREYYEILKKTQQGSGDITEWLVWFLDSLRHALRETENGMQNVLLKTAFWEKYKDVRINERQRLMINKLFDDFFGKLTSSKWAKITKCSADTALRDINDLIEKGILIKNDAGGRSASYRFA
ncbi:MAG: Fic family protein [Methanomassiliicoccaceae archaeon]|nr:Fic family protein [Methanomassiliicoccaceae archaeon]